MIAGCYSDGKKLFDLEMDSVPSTDISFVKDGKRYKVVGVKKEDDTFRLDVILWNLKVTKIIKEETEYG